MIGVFDSGTGGIRALSLLRAALPRADLCYFGDNARLPFGEKTDGEIRACVSEGLRFLVSRGAGAVFLACGTASTVAAGRIFCPVPVFGTAIPAAFCAARTGEAKIGVLATAASVRSGAYPAAVRLLSPRACVRQLACPCLVPLSEAGGDGDLTDLLAPMREFAPGVLLLGCTHFARLAPAIRRAVPGARLLDCGACGVRAFLRRASPFAEGRGRTEAFATGEPGAIDRAAAEWGVPGYPGAARVSL